MTKDYQEVERIVEEFKGLPFPDMTEDAFSVYDEKSEALNNWLRTTLTTYGNARELEGEKKAVEEFESKRDADSCECDNCNRWRKYRKNKLSYIDHITKVKRELK
jgi:hypothetical protein